MSDEGTAHDAAVQLGYEETQDATREKVRGAFREMKTDGMTWVRATDFPEYKVILVEGWKERPDKEAPAVPFLTHAQTT